MELVYFRYLICKKFCNFVVIFHSIIENDTFIMKEFKKKGTSSTPTVILDPKNNKFEISGKSLPEDVSSFYDPILKWIDEYAQSPNDETIFDFKLLYYNTASSKLLYEIMVKLKTELADEGHEVLVRWHYDEDDEDMEEAGEEYSEVVEDLPFELVANED